VTQTTELTPGPGHFNGPDGTIVPVPELNGSCAAPKESEPANRAGQVVNDWIDRRDRCPIGG